MRSPAENAEIIVSACKDPGFVDVSPDGEVVWIYEKLSEVHYLLNLRTDEKNPVPESAIQLWIQSSGILKMMSPELLLRQGRLFINPPDYRPYQIVSLTDGSQFSLIDVGALIDVYSPDGTINAALIDYFQSADQVFVHRGWQIAVATVTDFRHHPERNVVLHQIYLDPEFDNGDELLIEFLNMYNVNYQIIDVDLINKDNYSPLGNYLVRGDGVHLKDDHLIMDRRAWGGNFKGWYYDDSAIIVQPSTDWLISIADLGNLFRIPQPVLKVRLPAVTPNP